MATRSQRVVADGHDAVPGMRRGWADADVALLTDPAAAPGRADPPSPLRLMSVVPAPGRADPEPSPLPFTSVVPDVVERRPESPAEVPVMEPVVPVVPDPATLPAAGAGIDGVLFGTTNGLMPVAPPDVVVPPDVAPLCVERPPGVVAPATPPPIPVVCARAGVAMQSVAIAMYNFHHGSSPSGSST